MRPYCKTKNIQPRCTKVKAGELKNGELFYVKDTIDGTFYLLTIALDSCDKEGWIQGKSIFSKSKFWDNYHVSCYEGMYYDTMKDGTPYHEFYRLDGYGSYYQNGGEGHYWLDYDNTKLIFGYKTTEGNEKGEKMKTIRCEAMNSFGIWDKVCLWHDGSGETYAEETYKEFCEDLKNGFTAWKKVRLVSLCSKGLKVLKEQNNVAEFRDVTTEGN